MVVMVDTLRAVDIYFCSANMSSHNRLCQDIMFGFWLRNYTSRSVHQGENIHSGKTTRKAWKMRKLGNFFRAE